MPFSLEHVGQQPGGDVLRGFLERTHNDNGTLRVGVDVKAMGATGDGTTNDTAAIQAAIDFANAVGSGTVAFPAGTYRYSQLTLKSGVVLVGAGMYATMLKQTSGANVPGIVLSTTTTDLVGVRSLTIDGNKANQTGGVSHGIKIDNANPQASYRLFDPYFLLVDVAVQNCDGAGVYLTGARGSALLTRVFALLNNLQGFYIDTSDCNLSQCWAGSNFFAGFHITVNGGNHVFGNCRAFTNGATVTSASDIAAGFYFDQSSGNVLASCSSNANGSHGFQFNAPRRTTLSACNAGGNGTNGNFTTTGSGFYLKTPAHLSIQGQSYNYPGQTAQSYGLFLESPNGSNCRYEIQFGTGAGTANNVAAIGGTNGVNATLNQTVRQSAAQQITYAASITPDPTLGEIVLVGTLTGGITVNNPSISWTGAQLTFTFLQDGTGGRAVTWGSQFKTNWTPDTTLNKRNTISFVCDGQTGTAVWVQTGAATGL